MKVLRINSNTAFGRSLRNDEVDEYRQTLREAKKVTGQTGKSTFIIPMPVLPVSESKDTGIGHLTSKEGIDFIDYMHTYLDFNIVKDLPSGQIKKYKNFFCSYEASSLALGDQNINPELLLTDEYENLLTKDEFLQIVNSNNKNNKHEFINCENTMESGSSQDNVLKKAFERFKKLDDSNKLKQKYNKFVKENDFWLKFPREAEPEQEFFKFKQFLAEEHLAKGKKLLNDRGIKLCGDCLINFTKDEVNAFPKAFKQGYNTGLPAWGIPTLDYDTILDESSDAYKLLKSKVQLMARRYDVIRFDVGWNYIAPIMTPHGENKVLPENKKYLGSALVDNIDKWVREIKGEDFDLKNLVYEVEAGPNEFSPFKPDSSELIEPLKKRVKAYSNVYMQNNWGSNDAFTNKFGWDGDTFSIGTGNHDHQPLKQIAKGMPDSAANNQVHKTDSIEPLARILKIDPKELDNPSVYSKAKFAEIMSAKNIHYFFMDVLGCEERYNEHNPNSATSFRRRVPFDYKKAYQDALHEGFGFNIMDAFERVFKAKGYDKSNPDLYKKIVKFRDILIEKEPVQFKTAANSDDDIVRLNFTGEKNTKKLKMPKILLIASGCAALAGGIFSFYKNKDIDN